jgi:CheY-like chemotaxis protein
MDDSNYTILLVEDDENDATLMKMAFEKNKITNPVQWVRDGLEAVAYLNGDDAYADRAKYPFPEVLLLDLKMPRMTGMELLAWISEHPDFRIIPTIIMTSSRQELDIEKAYNLGANTYMTKPCSFDELAQMVKLTHEYWAVSAKPKTKHRKTDGGSAGK